MENGRYIVNAGKDCEFAGKFDIDIMERAWGNSVSVRPESFMLIPVYIKDPPPHQGIKPIVDDYYEEWYKAVEIARANMPSDGKVFLGNKYCRKCHREEYDRWVQSPHAAAFNAFEENPEQRCIPCHTTGFGYPTGFWDLELSPGFAGVGCEECHNFIKIPGMKGAHPVDEITTETCSKCHQTPHDREFKFEEDVNIIQH